MKEIVKNCCNHTDSEWIKLITSPNLLWGFIYLSSLYYTVKNETRSIFFLWITLFTWKDLVDCQGLKFFPKFHFSLFRCHNTADIFNSAKLNFQTLSIPFPLYLKTSHLFFKAFLCPTQSIKNRTPLESYFSVLHLEFSSNRFSLPSVHRKKFYRMPCHCVTRLPFFQLPISISLLVMKVLHFNI